MELYHLRTFIAVAREQHLTRSAGVLHISQSSVSTHIKTLEEELGLALFIRTRKGMVLTRDGQVLLKEAEQAVKAAESVCLSADRLKKRLSGTVRIGTNLEPDFLQLPGLTDAIRRDTPDLGLHFFERHSAEAKAQVLDGMLDLAFVFENPGIPSLDAVCLCRVEVVAVAPYGWQERLAGKGGAQLAEFPWIWTHEACPFNAVIRELFRPFNCLPEQTMVLDHEKAVREMVVSGAGIGLMVKPKALEAAQKRQLVILGDPAARMDLHLICLKSRMADPGVFAVRQMILSLWTALDRK